MEKVNLAEKFSRFSEQWSPKVVGELNGSEVKIAKIQGEFVWHRHEEADEMFLVVKGRMTIRMHDGDVELSEGEFFVVPRGVEHCPVADEECQIVMLEPKGTLNTGNVESERTVADPERI